MESTQKGTKKVTNAYTYNNDKRTQITGWNLRGTSGAAT